MKKSILKLALLTLSTCLSLQADESLLYTQNIPLNNSLSTYSSQANTPLQPFEKELIQYIQLSVANAENGISKLTPEVLAIEGMSSSKIRHCLNNLCSYPETSYLEIGCWKGSTFISALYKNEIFLHSAFGIDNWSEFGNVKDEFVSNTKTYLSDVLNDLITIDCFDFDPQSLPMPVNIFTYDGEHTVENQANAFKRYNEILTDTFIAIVDDWNWNMIREGAFKAFDDLNYTVLYEIALPSQEINDKVNWWNGYYIAVVRKNSP